MVLAGSPINHTVLRPHLTHRRNLARQFTLSDLKDYIQFSIQLLCD